MLLVRDALSGAWRLFERPLTTVIARTVDDVVPALAEVEAQCIAHRRHAAGFISYDASSAFDAALRTQAAGPLPLLWFGIYASAESVSLETVGDRFHSRPAEAADEVWAPSISPERYAEVFDRIQELIRNGDTYQVNFTYRLRSTLRTAPLDVFLRLASADTPPFGAYLDIGDWAICSFSPELFFHRSGTVVESRPMKGTAARGLWFEQDLEQARRLAQSDKQRAENVMIVDMVRNDLGRVARAGSVAVTNLFEVERYPTVLQMTSTVRAETDASLVDVMRALFPAASITGAPKARTTGIIADLECSPRQIYTGTIGFVEPGGRAQFNVAIRTLLIDKSTGAAEYGVGGGLVADSLRNDEWRESGLKARVLTTSPPSFDLLETMLWQPDAGYVLLDRHLRRLLQSADYFGFRLDLQDLRSRLAEFSSAFERRPQRVRLLASRHGGIALTRSPHDPQQDFGNVALAVAAIDSGNPFLYHKTTHRVIYEQALAARPGFADVILYNERQQVTESTIANIVVELDGELFTPPIESGVLPGTLRAHLIDEGRIRERPITVREMLDAQARYLLNSVRGFHPLEVSYETVT